QQLRNLCRGVFQHPAPSRPLRKLRSPMAISNGRNKRKLVADINVVPYIDVMLVLLIVFMITAPLLMQGVKVDLPNAPSNPLDEKDKEPLIVSVKADGTYYIDLGNGKNEEEILANIQ